MNLRVFLCLCYGLLVNGATFSNDLEETIHSGFRFTQEEPINPPNYAKKVIISNYNGKMYPTTFSLMNEIEDLHIHGSNITELDPFTFASLPNLRHLRLSFNYLPDVKNDWFKNCENLKTLAIVSNKKIGQFDADAFSNVPKLEKVVLMTDTIPYVITKEFFSGSKFLKQIMIHDCEVVRVEPDVFDGLDMLNFVSFAKNNLTEIAPGTFKGNHLREIYLGWNNLNRITGEELGHLEELEKFDFSNNPIVSVDLDAILERAPNLATLSMVDTFLSCKEKLNMKNQGGDKLKIRICKYEIGCCQNN